MINVLLILLIINTISSIQFEELPKYDTIEVAPNTRVYLDISSFEVGQSIYIEFTLDLFFSKQSKDFYTFQIGQVHSKFKDDYIYWSNLPNVTSRNVSETRFNSKDYTYTWVEIKKEGMNYLYILPPEPYEKFYTFWQNKITIKNLGGKSAREIRKRIANITVPIVFVITVISFIIFVFCKMKKNNINNNHNINDFPPASTILELPGINNPNHPLQNQEIQEQNKDNVLYPKPISPMGPSVN